MKIDVYYSLIKKKERGYEEEEDGREREMNKFFFCEGWVWLIVSSIFSVSLCYFLLLVIIVYDRVIVTTNGVTTCYYKTTTSPAIRSINVNTLTPPLPS